MLGARGLAEPDCEDRKDVDMVVVTALAEGTSDVPAELSCEASAISPRGTFDALLRFFQPLEGRFLLFVTLDAAVLAACAVQEEDVFDPTMLAMIGTLRPVPH